MVEAPEKIWADSDGEWHGHDYSGVRPCVVYLRADIAERQIAELRAEVEALHSHNVAGFDEEQALRKAAEADKARLSEALTEIAESDDIDNALDPARNKRIAHAALSGSGAGGWRTMDSAPKDGSEFLAALSNGWIEILSSNKSIRDNWCYSWWTARGRNSIPYEPTHPSDTDWSATATLRAIGWMPLPTAPTGDHHD